MNTALLLNSADRCARLPYLLERWRPPGIRPVEALYEAIEAGLTSAGTPWDAAEQRLYDLATTRGLDSNQVDVLGEAEHLAALASFISYLLRPEGHWKRPEPIPLPDGALWHPSAFLDPSESHLRRIVLCSTWNPYRQVEEEHDWRTLEGSIYGVAMDLVVVVIGQERDGRRHGPLSKGWTHPVSKQLRFRKRDGGGFDGGWEQIWREVGLQQGDMARRAGRGWRAPRCDPDSRRRAGTEGLVQYRTKKLERIRTAKEPPEESPSMCFDRVRPCPFRSACPRGLEPSPELGFTSCP